MAIFQVTPHDLQPISETTFGAEGILERQDLQRLLHAQISVLGERLMVIAEEFGEWVDSSRRIDLLCLDTDANLVVVELKRTEDGGHMDLQALRYAAMVSEMTFEQMVETHARQRNPSSPDHEQARKDILAFLHWDHVDEEQFAQDTRIVLAAADFGKELTTSVMWLIERGIDIRCLRMKPYRMVDGTLLLDVQQLIPLPEARDFQIQIGVKKQAERRNRAERHDLRLKFWQGLLATARPLSAVHANRTPSSDGWMSGGIGRSGISLTYSIRQKDAQVELWIGFGTAQAAKNKLAFKALEAQKAEIEAEFGAPLEWQESLPNGDGCRIRRRLDGGYASPELEWPQIHLRLAESMARLDTAMRQRVARLPL